MSSREALLVKKSRLQKQELRHLVTGNRWPIWQGQPLAAKTIVLRTEQGFGDSIQFIRFATDLVNQGATVHTETSPPLLRLLASANWRWQAEGNGSRWYPSARLFRQATPGNWDEVVAALAQALPQFALERTKAGTKGDPGITQSVA